jgi:hypothetical protein
MPRQTLEKRVDMLERSVEALEQLPGRVAAVESQIVQLREEVRSEFSATRQELRREIQESAGGLREELRREMREGATSLREEMHGGFSGLRLEMHDLFAASERHARVLYEDLVARIASLREGR